MRQPHVDERIRRGVLRVVNWFEHAMRDFNVAMRSGGRHILDTDADAPGQEFG